MTFNNLIIISWDGVQLNHLLDLQSQLTNLQRIGSNGSLSYLINHDSYTVTDPGHAQMLTGYEHLVTNITTNAFEVIPDNLTIWERAIGTIENLVFVSSRNCDPPECLGGHGFVRTEFSNSLSDATFEFDPALYSEEDDGGKGVLLPDLQQQKCQDGVVEQLTADYTTSKFLEWLDTYSSGRFLAFIHFGEPDAYGHTFGENSAAYTQGIFDCDAATGRILDALEARSLLSSSSIFVTTDHGFNESGFGQGAHFSEPYPAGDPNCYISFCINNSIQQGRRGLLIDLVPTALLMLGIDISSVTPAYPGKPLWQRPIK